MSLFFDTQFQLPEGEIATCSAWSNSEYNQILAVATDKPRVVFVNEEGKTLPSFEISRGKIQPVCLKWHPHTQSMAIGWSDGKCSYSLTLKAASPSGMRTSGRRERTSSCTRRP